MTTPNPFSDSHQALDANPFADPSIQGALGSTRQTYGDDDDLSTAQHQHNPYDASTETVDKIPAANGSTYVIPSLGGPGGDSAGSRMEEIRRREAELAERERNLGQREQHVKDYGRNNWPPFFPLIFHDIDTEIPEESKPTVLLLYRVWLFLILTLIVNLVGTILLLTSGQNDGGKDLGSGITYLPIIGITSFLLWYRPFYNAYMKEWALFYYIFFLFAGFHIAYCVYMVIGIPATGSAGLINTIRAFASGSIVTGVFGVLATAGWVIEGLGVLWIYRLTWARHNDKGLTFAQAKTELGAHGLMAYFKR